MEKIRQGDVLLLAVNGIAIPSGIQPKAKVVLAEGELTGHNHVLTAPQVYEWNVDGQRYVRVSGDMGTIMHEEHDPQPARVIDPDVTYRVIQQQEWDLKEQWRPVQD